MRTLFLISNILLVLLFSCKTPEPPKIITVDPENFDFIAASAERPIDLNPNDWILDSALSDQFDRDYLNGTRWENDINDWGPWSWEPQNAYQGSENLNIKMVYEEHSRSGQNLFYKSGILRSKDTLTYGYVEAKIKGIQTFPGASPAFWLYSIGGELDGWGLRGNDEGAIRYSEVDVIEMLQGNWNAQTGRDGPEVMDCNLHTVVIENGVEKWKRPGGFPDLTKNVYHAPWDPRDDYHTYGAEIRRDTITWYIDGMEIAKKENVYWHLPMHVTLSLGLRYPHVTYNNCPNGLERCAVPSEATQEGFPTEMKVDWVRCYRRK